MFFFHVILLTASLPSSPIPEEQHQEPARSGPSCRYILQNLNRAIGARSVLPLEKQPVLRTEDTTNGPIPCGHYESLLHTLAQNQTSDVESGVIGGHPAVILRNGPNGSGHYWDVTVAIAIDGVPLGACFTTTTIAWRNIHRYGDRFGSWEPFLEDPKTKDRFMLVWSSVQGDPTGTNASYLLLPLVYTVRENELVLDLARTRAQISRFASIYEEIASENGNRLARLHLPASQAFQAYVEQTTCAMK